MVQLSRGILASNGNTAILTKVYLPLQPFSAPIHNYNTPLLLTPLILFILVANTHTDRKASVSNYEGLFTYNMELFRQLHNEDGPIKHNLPES